MKKRILSALAVAVLVGISGAAMANDGAAVYKAKCLACHGPEGKGSPMAPGFAGSEYIASATDADISDVITNGRNGAAKTYKEFVMGMPPQKLTDAELSAVVAYLKNLSSR